MNTTMHEFTPQLHVVSGKTVAEVLTDIRPNLVDLVLETYQLHEQGKTINPDSYFLRYPESERNRIIALPAAVMDVDNDISGIKWIASYPDNTLIDLARASAVIVLNDNQYGYPFAFLEAASISAARTAASAVLGASVSKQDKNVDSITFVGSGVIARSIAEQFHANGWSFEKVRIHDLHDESALSMASFCDREIGWTAETCSLEESLRSEIVVFATSAASPYVHGANTFEPGQCVLNISLRDLAPEVILNSYNIVDDIDHCMKANTSPHLAEQSVGHRDFVVGTVARAAAGDIKLANDKPIVYSPFGMGILDLVVAKRIFDVAVKSGRTQCVENFFGDCSRWSA